MKKPRAFSELRIAVMASQKGKNTDDCSWIRVNGTLYQDDIDMIVEAIRDKLEDLFVGFPTSGPDDYQAEHK